MSGKLSTAKESSPNSTLYVKNNALLVLTSGRGKAGGGGGERIGGWRQRYRRREKKRLEVRFSRWQENLIAKKICNIA